MDNENNNKTDEQVRPSGKNSSFGETPFKILPSGSLNYNVVVGDERNAPSDIVHSMDTEQISIQGDGVKGFTTGDSFVPNDDIREEKEEKECEEILELSSRIDELEESVSDIRSIIENIQFNVAMLVQNQASAADIAVLRKENEAFRNDSNVKLMRRYGIDAMIKTYQAICDRIFRINHPVSKDKKDEIELNTLNWVLIRLEKQLKPMGIKLRSSQPGSAIDESVMVVYGSDVEDIEDEETVIATDDEKLKDTVKESVCPAFIWTIPSLIGDVKEWCMEAEKVCIYK